MMCYMFITIRCMKPKMLTQFKILEVLKTRMYILLKLELLNLFTHYQYLNDLTKN